MTRKSLTSDNLNNFLHRTAPKKKLRLINDQILNNFQPMLREETCDATYSKNNFNKIVNDFQCILIGNFENSFTTMLNPGRSQWGTYHGCCFQRDGARTSVKMGSWAGLTHLQ